MAYRLTIPDTWKVYLVISIAQLEACPDPEIDPYLVDRPIPRPDEPPPVFVEGDTPTFRSFELDHIFNKRVIKKGRGFATEYLIKWKGYRPEHDVWRNVNQLGDAQDLIQDYENAGQPRQIGAPEDVASTSRQAINQIADQLPV